MEGHSISIDLPYSKEMASSILVMSILTIAINFGVLCCMYKRRTTSTSIIVCNLACVDILVTVKDIYKFLDVSATGRWEFEESWCSSYGLTSVIFIIISVSTLVTISSERFSRLKEIAALGTTGSWSNPVHNPLILGYVIAHTTLSYSLSLLWSKYVFVSRKGFCRVEWPPQYGISITFLSSIIFIIPVSTLVYNVMFKSLSKDTSATTSNQLEKTKSDISEVYDERAQKELHIAVAIFLCSWTPYVIESLLSSRLHIPPNLGILVACIPMFTTSLLPLFYVSYRFPDQSKTNEFKIMNA